MEEKLLLAFKHAYGHTAQFKVRAPGRVNIIGEHTDYNDGYVLPCAISYETLVAAKPRSDDLINVLALDLQNQTDSFYLGEKIVRHPEQLWSNYIRGVCIELGLRGYPLRGCDLAITGNVPQGAGLSSSASLEIGIAFALLQAAGLEASPLELARVGQAAENNFVGCACGIMDQLISAAGVTGRALAIDCRDLSMTPVSLPESLDLLMVNSNVKRGLVDSEYNSRRLQCESAAKFFGQQSLRDVSLRQLREQHEALDPLVFRRAKHVLEENQRVLDTVSALEAGDIQAVSRLMAESHRSMRDLFEITTPEIDFLVRVIAESCGDRGGVRMTGGGFGGCVVALVESELMDATIKSVAERYQAETGLTEIIYTSRPCQGVSLL